MTHPHTDPLTPEERDLAQRLSRIGPHGEPSSALDARILSAAHAAVAVTTPRHRPRWPAMMGVAATLALAVGLAWQLRPQPEEAAMMEEGPATAVAPQATAAMDAVSASEAREKRPTEVAATPALPRAPTQPPLAEQKPAAAQRHAPVPRRGTAPPAKLEVRGEAPPGAEAISPPMVADMAVAAPPPAPAAPPAPSAMPTPAPEPRAAKAAAAAPAPSERTRTFSIEAAAPAASLPDTPIAEDARLAPAAWLDRIRVRRDSGDLDGARASLRLFRDRHPSLPIPDDLRALTR